MRTCGALQSGRLRFLILLGLISTSTGCASGHVPRRLFGGQSEGATIGRDLRLLPRGSVVPVTGLGVDLVGRSFPEVPVLTKNIASPEQSLQSA